jgi:hypothetical protein
MKLDSPKTIAGLFVALAGAAGFVFLSSPKSAPVAPARSAIFDVPSLIGLNISQVKAKLGAPSEFDDPAKMPATAIITELNMSWEKQGRNLLATYQPSNGRVVDFFIATNDATGATPDVTDIYPIGNLSEGDSRYSLKPVQAGNSGKFTGIIITPNP